MIAAFRRAVAADAPAVAALINSAYRGEGAKAGWTTESDILDGRRTDEVELLALIARPDSRIELAFSGAGELLGTVHLAKEPSGACYLGMLTVRPALQGAGLGKLLMERSEALARDWGCTRMRMTVIHVRSELLAFYERRGYVRTGKVEPYPERDSLSVPKVSGLSFLELVKSL